MSFYKPGVTPRHPRRGFELRHPPRRRPSTRSPRIIAAPPSLPSLLAPSTPPALPRWRSRTGPRRPLPQLPPLWQLLSALLGLGLATVDRTRRRTARGSESGSLCARRILAALNLELACTGGRGRGARAGSADAAASCDEASRGRTRRVPAAAGSALSASLASLLRLRVAAPRRGFERRPSPVTFVSGGGHTIASHMRPS
ncbi:hypothetical protein PVAP13_5KG400207 [Panicum virgatum]|uniref:Uncharacterized protein n=1 Tax=Panicum virgatum TaxID=38727 RepID=A0A8T0SNZ0_PANVG|nr:hypothetical protein PVAP13_5KG400207 [Panicum virgatum]